MESILTSTTDISKLVQERPYPSPDDDMSLSNKFFQGGNYRILHDLLGIRSGGSILYVGDHIYSDILRSKRNLGWRTCLIVPELSNEILIHRDLMTIRRELMSIRRQQYLMENDLDALYGQQSLLSLQKGQHLVKQALITRIQQVEEELTILREELRERFVEFDLNFHDRWGQVRDSRPVLNIFALSYVVIFRYSYSKLDFKIVVFPNKFKILLVFIPVKQVI